MFLAFVRPLMLAAAAVTFAAPSTHAQGRLDARYSVTLAGLPIGKGVWVIDIADGQFTAAASGSASGLMRVFASGQGSGASRGLIVGGAPVPASFASSITADKRTEEVYISMAGGNIKDYSITPPSDPHPERLPVTEAHRRGASDPMTSVLMKVAGSGDPLRPEACQRTTPVFDGRMRYDLKFAFKRMDRVKADKGYEGPVVVCAVYFSPIAGYVPSRSSIKYLIDLREMEVWLAPVAATRILVPFRISIPTPFGTAVLEATQFVTAAQPRAAAAGPKTQ